MKELTNDQIIRQDFVDNAIYQLIQLVNPTDTAINWDIEMIGNVRDVIGEFLVEKTAITEQQFYPFLD